MIIFKRKFVLKIFSISVVSGFSKSEESTIFAELQEFIKVPNESLPEKLQLNEFYDMKAGFSECTVTVIYLQIIAIVLLYLHIVKQQRCFNDYIETRIEIRYRSIYQGKDNKRKKIFYPSFLKLTKVVIN